MDGVKAPLSTDERVYMCTRVLEDGERERAAHFRVVDAGAYEESIAEIARLRAKLTTIANLLDEGAYGMATDEARGL